MMQRVPRLPSSDTASAPAEQPVRRYSRSGPRLLALLLATVCVGAGFGALAQSEAEADSDEASADAASPPADAPLAGDVAVPDAFTDDMTLLVDGVIERRDVVVAEGDTLSSIARRELGSAGLAGPLAEFNNLELSAPLQPGQTLQVPVLVPAVAETATVLFVKGRVTLDGEPLMRDADVIVGERIETGPDGFASLQFSSGSVVNIQPDTRASITRLACLEGADTCVVEIESGGGALNSDVEARDGQPLQFRISTPFAAAAVRGTEFSFSAEPGELKTAVTEGQVLVQAQDTEIPLISGFGSVTREGEPPGTPIALLRAPVFRSVPSRLAPGDLLGWFGLAAADGYSTNFSVDAAGAQSVASFEGDDASLELDEGIEPGDYYVSLNAIDENGIPGFSSSARLTVADIARDTAPVETRVSREGSEYIVQVIDPPASAPGFEVQVAVSPDFEDPLGVDVTRAGRAILSIDVDTLYARARTLIDPTTVSAFGPVSSNGD